MRKLLALVFAASIGFTVTSVEGKQGGPAHSAPKPSGSSGAAKSGQNAASQGAKPTKSGDHGPRLCEYRKWPARWWTSTLVACSGPLVPTAI